MMSVDTLRETFHLNRVTPDKIQDFLTAQTYRPEITRAKEKIKVLPWAFLQSVCKRPIRQGKSPSYAEDAGLLCIKPKNTNEMIVSLEELSHIQPASKDEIAGQRLQRGDIVITRSGSGTIGRASIFLSDEEVYTNDHLFIVRTDAADSHYTCAFLNTYWGHRLLEAGISGSTGQLNLSNEHIKGITLYTPAELAQKYIGDKVRQAERLRAWAKRRYQESLALFKEAVATYGYQQKVGKSFVWAKLDNRLDPAYYDPKYSFLDETWFLTHSRPLREFIIDGAYGVLPDSNSYGSGNERFIRATDIRQSNIDPTAFTCVPSDQVAPKAKIKTGDILLEIKGAIEACELAGAHLHGAYVNGSIYRFTPRNIKSGYLAFYLRSFIKQLYCERVSVNNIIAYLDLGSISALPVLRLSAEQEESIEQAFLSHLESARYGFALTKAAKMLSEALIEGLLTETELIAAEQALQAGNDQLDRHVLNRLKADGINGQGPALLGDLDELYHLLTLAEGD
jgi:type I restriction enzyme, S subunit